MKKKRKPSGTNNQNQGLSAKDKAKLVGLIAESAAYLLDTIFPTVQPIKERLMLAIKEERYEDAAKLKKIMDEKSNI